MLGKLILMLLVASISLNALGKNCEEVSLECTITGGEKEIAQEKVYKDCWQYSYKLDCKKQSKNNCDQIPADDCLFLKQECKDKIKVGEGEFCTNYNYHYSCGSGDDYVDAEGQEFVKQGDPVDSKELMCDMMCIDGNCSAINKAKFEENNELKEAAAALNAMGEIKKDIQGDSLVNIFKGDSERCKVVLNKKLFDCCRIKGVLQGDFDCEDDEINLAKKRNDKKCVEVGKYCAEKVRPFGCIKRYRTFCCYDSVLSRIINQEAKRQLGINNGTPKDPNCGPIPLADLKKVDLSKADFSDFYDEIVVPSIKIPDVKVDAQANEKNAENIINSAENLPEIKKGFNPDIKEIQ